MKPQTKCPFCGNDAIVTYEEIGQLQLSPFKVERVLDAKMKHEINVICEGDVTRRYRSS